MLMELIGAGTAWGTGLGFCFVAVVWAVVDYLKLKLVLKGSKPEDRPKILHAWRQHSRAPRIQEDSRPPAPQDPE